MPALDPIAPVPPAARRALPASILAGAFTLLWAAVLAASYLKSDLTRNDFERFDDLRLSFLFFALFAGLAGAYAALAARGVTASRRALAGWSALWLLLALAAFPVGSKDVFGYAFTGKMWHGYGANPYLATAADFPDDPWQAFIQVWWRGHPSVYGPVFLWQARGVAALATDSLWVSVWLHKLAAAAVCGLTFWAGAALLRRTAPAAAPALFALLVWNPLFLFETAGCAHNDIAMVLLVFTALVCRHDGRGAAALAVLVVAVWYKWYAAIFLPAFLLETIKTRGWRAAAGEAAVVAGALVAIGAVFLAPLPGSLSTILAQLARPSAMRGLYPTELSPPLALLFWIARPLGWLDTDEGIRLFHAVRVGLFALAAAGVLFWQWRAPASTAVLARSCFGIVLAFVFLLVTMLLPWHLLCAIGLGLVAGTRPFALAAVALTVLGLLSYFLTFGVATAALVAAGAVLLRPRARAAG